MFLLRTLGAKYVLVEYIVICLPGVAVGSPGVGERKISFAVLGHVDRSDSLHSSTTSISVMDPNVSPHTPAEERKGNHQPIANPVSHLFIVPKLL